MVPRERVGAHASRGPVPPAGVVLVGVDGSAASWHALEWAADEAARRGWSLHLVCAYTVPVAAGIAGEVTTPLVDDDTVRVAAQACCDQAAEVVVGRAGIPDVRTSVRYGDAAGVLVDESQSASLAVIGKRGRGGFASRLLGGVSSALPAHAACPTAVVPLPHGTGPAARGGPRPGAGTAPGRRGVVVGVDGSPASAHAAEVAAGFAAERGWPLNLLCAVPLAVPTLAWLPTALDPDPLLAEVRSELDAAAQAVRDHHPGLDVDVSLAHDTPARALTQASAEAGLVVVGARGHGGFAGLLLGSVSQAVLRHAESPVIVIPRPSPR
jgi:nucleotide-binding universal stress UspA family protein